MIEIAVKAAIKAFPTHLERMAVLKKFFEQYGTVGTNAWIHFCRLYRQYVLRDVVGEDCNPMFGGVTPGYHKAVLELDAALQVILDEEPIILVDYTTEINYGLKSVFVTLAIEPTREFPEQYDIMTVIVPLEEQGYHLHKIFESKAVVTKEGQNLRTFRMRLFRKEWHPMVNAEGEEIPEPTANPMLASLQGAFKPFEIYLANIQVTVDSVDGKTYSVAGVVKADDQLPAFEDVEHQVGLLTGMGVVGMDGVAKPTKGSIITYKFREIEKISEEVDNQIDIYSCFDPDDFAVTSIDEKDGVFFIHGVIKDPVNWDAIIVNLQHLGLRCSGRHKVSHNEGEPETYLVLATQPPKGDATIYQALAENGLAVRVTEEIGDNTVRFLCSLEPKSNLCMSQLVSDLHKAGAKYVHMPGKVKTEAGLFVIGVRRGADDVAPETLATSAAKAAAAFAETWTKEELDKEMSHQEYIEYLKKMYQEMSVDVGKPMAAKPDKPFLTVHNKSDKLVNLDIVASGNITEAQHKIQTSVHLDENALKGALKKIQDGLSKEVDKKLSEIVSFNMDEPSMDHANLTIEKLQQAMEATQKIDPKPSVYYTSGSKATITLIAAKFGLKFVMGEPGENFYQFVLKGSSPALTMQHLINAYASANLECVPSTSGKVGEDHYYSFYIKKKSLPQPTMEQMLKGLPVSKTTVYSNPQFMSGLQTKYPALCESVSELDGEQLNHFYHLIEAYIRSCDPTNKGSVVGIISISPCADDLKILYHHLLGEGKKEEHQCEILLEKFCMLIDQAVIGEGEIMVGVDVGKDKPTTVLVKKTGDKYEVVMTPETKAFMESFEQEVKSAMPHKPTEGQKRMFKADSDINFGQFVYLSGQGRVSTASKPNQVPVGVAVQSSKSGDSVLVSVNMKLVASAIGGGPEIYKNPEPEPKKTIPEGPEYLLSYALPKNPQEHDKVTSNGHTLHFKYGSEYHAVVTYSNVDGVFMQSSGLFDPNGAGIIIDRVKNPDESYTYRMFRRGIVAGQEKIELMTCSQVANPVPSQEKDVPAGTINKDPDGGLVISDGHGKPVMRFLTDGRVLLYGRVLPQKFWDLVVHINPLLAAGAAAQTEIAKLKLILEELAQKNNTLTTDLKRLHHEHIGKFQARAKDQARVARFKNLSENIDDAEPENEGGTPG